MDAREELVALRRLAALEAKAAGQAAPDASSVPTGQGGDFWGDVRAGAQQHIANIIERPLFAAMDSTPNRSSNDVAKAQKLKDFRASERAKYQNEYGGSNVAKGAGLATDIAITYPLGGMLAAPIRALGAPRLAQAVATGGFRTGAAPVGLGARAADLGIRSVGGGITGAATAGLVDPESAGTGAAIGAALPGAVKALGGAGRGLASLGPQRIDPARAQLAQQMIDQGVDILPAQLSRSPTTKAVASILKDAPITGGMARNALDTQTNQFGNALSRTIGQQSGRLDEGTMTAARKDIGGRLDAIWKNNNLPVNDAFFKELDAIRSQALREQPGPQGQALANKIDDFLAKAEGGSISGEAANRFQSSLRKMPDDLSAATKRAVINAFNKSISGADAKALAQARNQYGNWKTLEPLADKSTTGDISPANLLARVVAGGNRPDLVPLAKGAKEFMVDRTPQTGGSTRAMLQNSLLGAGVGATAMGMGVPAAAVGLGGLASIGALVQKGLVSPEIGRRMVKNARKGVSPFDDLGNRLAPLNALAYRSAPLLATGQ